jgi:hypothetical protein
MSQPQHSPWGGPPADPTQAGYPAPGAYPGQPGGYAQPSYAQPGYGQPAQAAPGHAIPAPYAGQPEQAYGGHAAPAAYPAQQAGYAPPPGMLACRHCGSVPAVDTKFRGHQGMIIVMRFLSNEGPFCRDCGLGVFRHMTSRTLVQGWWGYGSFIITPFTVLMNLFRRGKVANLAAPQPNPYGPSRPPMDPGARLLERPLTWAGLVIPLALIAFVIYAASQN